MTGHCYWFYMVATATDFKAKCLALIDQVAETGEEIVITKHGKPMVRVIRENSELERNLEDLKGSAEFVGDPFAPVISDSEIVALR